VAGSAVFVGRDRELARLRAIVGGGEARLLLVVGDAGVGKTGLVTEATGRAAVDGAVVVWGGCLPMREMLPLLPVVDALSELSGVDSGQLLEDALAGTPRYAQVEMVRLLPQRDAEAAESSGVIDAGQRVRLFAAIAELLGAVAQRRRIVLVVEDVHWADNATLDCLTYLTRARRDAGLTVVATCRSDEAPLASHVVEWLAHARGLAGTAEVRLDPLTRAETAEQVAELTGTPAPAPVVDELYARGEGNPFFTEQLVAAAWPQGGLGSAARLPARLAELLVTRAARCTGAARTVLSALAVAGRPLGEDLLAVIGELPVGDVRHGLRELSAARLLADPGAGGEQRPRHALLAEAVAAELLPGERVGFHERTAMALQAFGDDMLSAEAAGHWAAAGRVVEELPARVRAAEVAERVFGYAEAARHWQRAIELSALVPNPGQAAGLDLGRMYLRGVDALEAAGFEERSRELAAVAYRRFGNDPDPAVAAPISLRYAWSRWESEAPARVRALFEQALRLFEQLPPSADHAQAWSSYAEFLFDAEGDDQARRTALARGLEVAEAAGATGVAADIQARLGHDARLHGRVAEGVAMARRARTLAEASGDGKALIEIEADESDTLLKAGRFDEAASAALRGLEAARASGRRMSLGAGFVVGNAAEAMLALGRTDEAAQLIDPLTDEPPSRADHIVQTMRAEIDLLRGDVDAADRRLRQITSVIGRARTADNAREIAQRAAEVALWAGRPADGLADVRNALARYQSTDWTIQCGWLLALGMRACADLAEHARAAREETATQAALAAADDLAAWVHRMADAPFTDHPYVATIPAERNSWNAERSRLTETNDPAAWHTAAAAWAELGCPHRAAYAEWRHAEARLLAGERPTAVSNPLRSAATQATGHAPLLAAIHTLADRARIPLDTTPPPAEPHRKTAPYGLTERELLVLRLLATGRTNNEIGAELFISRKTASVHVSNILRKLGVPTRVQAAALAERAGLVDSPLTPDQRTPNEDRTMPRTS
jgi:ATP/maltotriose-dependent transcriptional regulator MalT